MSIAATSYKLIISVRVIIFLTLLLAIYTSYVVFNSLTDGIMVGVAFIALAANIIWLQVGLLLSFLKIAQRYIVLLIIFMLPPVAFTLACMYGVWVG